jgi:hypothetical protein
MFELFARQAVILGELFGSPPVTLKVETLLWQHLFLADPLLATPPALLTFLLADPLLGGPPALLTLLLAAPLLGGPPALVDDYLFWSAWPSRVSVHRSGDDGEGSVAGRAGYKEQMVPARPASAPTAGRVLSPRARRGREKRREQCSFPRRGHARRVTMARGSSLG